MRKSHAKPRRNGVRRLLVVSLLVGLAGCGDTQKRAAGKNLRQATDQARRLYDHALKILSTSDAGENESPDALPPLALEHLERARTILVQSLLENCDAFNNEPSSIPSADAGTARRMLSLVDRLRAQYHIWDLDQTLARSDVVAAELYRKLDQAQIRGALLTVAETYASLEEGMVRKSLKELQQGLEKQNHTVQSLRTEIRTREETQAKQKREIEDLSARAGVLRREKTLARGMESQKKLQEALELESRIVRLQNEQQRLEGELIHLRSSLGSEEVRQTEVQARIAALEEMQARQRDGAEEVSRTMSRRKEEFLDACREASASAAELNALAARAVEQARQAQSALEQAIQAVDAALTLLGADRKSQALSEAANLKAMEASLQRTLLSYRTALKGVSERMRNVWESLHDAKPQAPSEEGISALQESVSRASELSLSAYEKAVDYWEQAVRAAGREDGWQYRRELVVGMLDYASALERAGRTTEASEFRKRARDYFSEIESAASRAGKPRAIVPLQEFVRAETGS